MDLTYPINLRKDLRYSGDTAYYIDMIDAKPFFWDICEFDENRVPKVNYGPERGVHRNKTFICQWALANLNAFLDTDDQIHLSVYENQLYWLNSHIEYADGDKNKPLWYNHFDFVHQGQHYPGPWTGGLGHSLAISLFIRDYRMRGNDESLRLAKQLAWFVFLDAKDGGILCREGENLFFEEYNKPPFTRILDGLLFILLTVYDLYDVTGTRSYGEYFKQGCDTLERYLYRWDFDNQWSFYDIHRKQLSNPLYHAINYCLLEVLGKVANRPTLITKAKSWQSFIHEPWIETKINQTYFRLLENSSWFSYSDPRNTENHTIRKG